MHRDGRRAAIVAVRSVSFVAALAGCWTTPAAVPEVPVAKTKRCAIHDVEVSVAGTVTLSIEGLEFATQPGPFIRLDVVFHDAVGKTKLETDTLVLEGELDRIALPIRPRELSWHDGWVEIHSATARAAHQDLLKIGVELPEGVTPREAVFSLPCDGLTFAVAPDPPDTTDTPPSISLAIGTELHAKPGGPVIARVAGYRPPEALPKDPTQPLQVTLLSRDKEMTQVRIEGTNPMIAWASTKMTGPPVGDQLGGFGFGRSGYGRHTYACSRDVAIFVRVGGRAVRVGRLKKDAGFYLKDDVDSEDDDIGIDLGVAKPGTVPFLKKSDFGHCG